MLEINKHKISIRGGKISHALSRDLTCNSKICKEEDIWELRRVPDYTDENVSTKIVKIIQSYSGGVDRMVWRKY